MPVTLQQIAEAAGVSRGTVDRALNNRGRIRPEVAERIKNVARQMGYQPSRAGRALAMAKRQIKIGVILQYAETPFMQQVLAGVRAAKTEVESFGGIVEIHEIESVDSGKAAEYMRKFHEEGVRGIALSPSEDQTLKELIDTYVQEDHIPVVTLNADLEDTRRLCFVGQDTFRSGQTAAGLMGELTGGEGKIAVISGHTANPGLNNRRKGFEQEIHRSYPRIQLLDTRYSYDDEAVSAKIMEELMGQHPDLTGIYIAGHGVGGVCQTLKKAGKDKSLRVIANDFLEENIKWLREGTVDFLIGQDGYVQGHAPVMILFHLLFDNQPPKRELQYTEIVIKTRYNI